MNRHKAVCIVSISSCVMFERRALSEQLSLYELLNASENVPRSIINNNELVSNGRESILRLSLSFRRNSLTGPVLHHRLTMTETDQFFEVVNNAGEMLRGSLATNELTSLHHNQQTCLLLSTSSNQARKRNFTCH